VDVRLKNLLHRTIFQYIPAVNVARNIVAIAEMEMELFVQNVVQRNILIMIRSIQDNWAWA